MKQFAVFLIFAAVLTSGAVNTRAQGWETTLLDLGPSTGPFDVMVDPFHPTTKLIVAGRGSTEIGAIMHVDLTQNPVSTIVLDTYPGRIDELGFDAYAGALFSVGSVLQDGNRFWQVRRSLDQGATWGLAGAIYQYKAGAAAFALGFASDNAGKVFVCGYGFNRPGGNQMWIVRKSADQGASWTTYAAGKGFDDVASAVYFVPDYGPANRGGLFTVGRLNSVWTVQRSRDGGNTWATVDSWTASRNGTSVAKTITSDAQGRIFVAGHSSVSKGGNKCFVRTSVNSGDTWQPILENFGVAPAGSGSSYAIDSFLINGMKFDTANNLWTIGTTGWATANRTWTMLCWHPTTGWSAPFTPYGSPTTGNSIATDSSGNVYGLGASTDADGYSHLLLMQTSH